MKEVGTLNSGKRAKRALKISNLYWKEPLLAALLTAFCFLVMCALSDVYPFGKYTMMASDLEAQYAPFLFLYKRHLLNIDWSNFVSSFTYSSELGMGKNLMGTFGYYLASPINLIVLLFKSEQASLFIITLTGIKLSLASAFMTVFIHKMSSNKGKLPLLFGVMYAFSSYTMVYMMNIMWLDGYLLLPLLLFFIEEFMEDEYHRTYKLIITLLFLFIANYYIAYMVGVFSFIYLIVRLIEKDSFRTDCKNTFKLVAKFILSAVISALVVSVVLLPVAIDTLGNADPTHKVPTTDYVKFSAIDMVDRVFLGSPGDFAEVMPGNLPFIFISVACTLSVVVYFVSDVFKGKKRRIRAICLVGVYLSMAIKVIDLAWQAFDAPNWFWYRYSFVFIPLFLLITLNVIEKIKQVPNKDIVKATAILILLLFVAQSFGAMRNLDGVFLINLALVVGYALIFMLLKREKWPAQLANMNRLLPFILSLIIVFETAGIETIMSGGIASLSVYYGEGKPHAESILAMEDAARASRIADRGYRFELEHNYEGDDVDTISGNAAFYVGYNGITIFNSNSNKSLHRFLKQLGYCVNYNYFTAGYSFAAEDTDAFLSIGTLCTRMGYTGANYVASDGYGSGISFYYRDMYLPVGFAVDSDSMNFDFYRLETDTEEKNYFDFRNDWYASLFPSEFDRDFYVDVDVEAPELINCFEFDMTGYSSKSQAYIDSSISDSIIRDEAAGMSNVVDEKKGFDPDDLGEEPLESGESTSTLYRMNEDIPMLIKYTFTAPTSDEIYMCLAASRVINKCDVFINGRKTDGWGDFSFYSQVVRLGAFEPGEEVEVTILSRADQFAYQNISFAYLDSDAFRSMLSEVDRSKVTVENIENGRACFSCDLDEGEILLTTIPYEDGWTAYVDGKKADITVYQDALIAVDCGSGSHEVKLVFEAPGIKAGAVLSLVGIVGFVCLGVYDAGRRKKAGKVSESK